MIRGLHVDVKGLEVDPHRVRRNRKAPGGESVRLQQIAVLVVWNRNWNWDQRQQCQSNDEHCAEDGPHARTAMLADATEPILSLLQPLRA